MGSPILTANQIPIVSGKEQVINEPLDVDGTTYRITGVSMGNPHGVVFVDSVADIDIEKIGPKFENHPMFPDRVNTEFIELVDDNKVNLRIEAALLKDFKVKIETFMSGEAILKAYKFGRKYDIIFMDHMMPEMDGVETTKRIRKLPGGDGKNVRIIALTANAIQGVENEYIAAGMDDWIFKPVRQEQLKKMILRKQH